MAKSTTAPLVFVSGYLLAWAAAGVLAYAVADLGRSLLGSELSWDRGGPWLAGGILVVAAAYELTARHCADGRPRGDPGLDDPQRRRPTDGMNYTDEMRMP